MLLSRSLTALCTALILSQRIASVTPFGGQALRFELRAASRRSGTAVRASPTDEPSPSPAPPSLSPVSPLARSILDGGTEPSFSSDLNDEDRAGTFVCAGCEAPLFFAECKFDSGTGWPSFWATAAGAVEIEGGGFFANPLSAVFGRDCKCSACGGHLGHRFDDGPKRKTGKRFCINGAALRFRNDGPTPKGTPLDS